MVKRKELKDMITASEVAEIWRKRSEAEGKKVKYTRFSVYGQRDKLGYIETPLGFLYERARAEAIDLPKYNPRPDVIERNQKLKGRKRDKETGQFESVSEQRP
jgi:hypothetical protein